MAREDDLDAEEFSEALSGRLMELPTCPTQPNAECEAASCRWRCALEVIDELLARPSAVSGEEVDHLLDLRWQLRQQADPERALRLFCDLRLRMEKRHYLAFFRIRRWLENHLVAAVQLCPKADPHLMPVRLDRFCVEAIRRAMICDSIRAGKVLLAPRVQFAFLPSAQPTAAVSSAVVG